MSLARRLHDKNSDITYSCSLYKVKDQENVVAGGKIISMLNFSLLKEPANFPEDENCLDVNVENLLKKSEEDFPILFTLDDEFGTIQCVIPRNFYETAYKDLVKNGNEVIVNALAKCPIENADNTNILTATTNSKLYVYKVEEL